MVARSIVLFVIGDVTLQSAFIDDEGDEEATYGAEYDYNVVLIALLRYLTLIVGEYC